MYLPLLRFVFVLVLSVNGEKYPPIFSRLSRWQADHSENRNPIDKTIQGFLDLSKSMQQAIGNYKGIAQDLNHALTKLTKSMHAFPEDGNIDGNWDRVLEKEPNFTEMKKIEKEEKREQKRKAQEMKTQRNKQVEEMLGPHKIKKYTDTSTERVLLKLREQQAKAYAERKQNMEKENTGNTAAKRKGDAEAFDRTRQMGSVLEVESHECTIDTCTSKSGGNSQRKMVSHQATAEGSSAEKANENESPAVNEKKERGFTVDESIVSKNEHSAVARTEQIQVEEQGTMRKWGESQ